MPPRIPAFGVSRAWAAAILACSKDRISYLVRVEDVLPFPHVETGTTDVVDLDSVCRQLVKDKEEKPTAPYFPVDAMPDGLKQTMEARREMYGNIF